MVEEIVVSLGPDAAGAYLWHDGTAPRQIVVMLHGAGSHAGYFRALGAACVERGLALLALDRRGSGMNKQRPGLGSFTTWLSDIEEAVREARRRVAPGGRVYLGGWCWGGRLACLAASRGAPIDALVLLCPALIVADDVHQRALANRASDADPAPMPFTEAHFTDRPELQQHLRDEPVAWHDQPRAFIVANEASRDAAEGCEPAIAVPTYVLFAETDRLVNVAATQKRLEGIPQVTFDAMPGGHALLLEEPQQVADRVLSFVDGLDPSPDAQTRAFGRRARAAFLRFVARLPHARVEQQRLLLDECILPNVDTVFGREHGFAAIRTIEDFQRSVPIRRYDDFAPYIERTAAGEPRVLIAEPPAAFSRTSGTSGRAKKLISTMSFRLRHDVPRVLAACGNIVGYHPEVFERADGTINFIRDVAPPSKDSLATTASGVVYQSYTATFAAQRLTAMRGEPGTLAPWSSVPAEYVAERDRQYYRLRLAIEHDVVNLVAINPSTLVVFGQLVASEAERLAEELEAGTIHRKPGLVPNPTRAAELRALVRRHGRLRPVDVWPRLSLIQCWTAASCALYLPAIRELYGEHTAILPLATNASEGPLAVPIDDHLTRGAPVVTDVFYELVPVDVDIVADTKTRLLHELEPGREYEVVMTQPNGLYRYAIGDVVRVLDFAHGVPLVEFVGRKGVASSFTGEKLTESQILAATLGALAKMGVRFVDATCFPMWGEPPHYQLVVEPQEALDEPALAALGRAFDEALAAANDEYPGKRSSGRLAEARAIAVGPGTFARYREKLIAAGASAAQMKAKVVHKDPAVLDELLQLVP